MSGAKAVEEGWSVCTCNHTFAVHLAAVSAAAAAGVVAAASRSEGPPVFFSRTGKVFTVQRCSFAGCSCERFAELGA